MKLVKSLIFSYLANQNKWGPEVRVGILLTELFHRGLEGSGHIAGFYVALVEDLHEFGSGAVVDVPEREQQGGCAGTEEAALETKQFVAGSDDVHSGSAPAERHMTSGEAHLIEIVQVKVAIPEPDARKHRVVLAISAVGGDVEQGALGALALEDVRGGLRAEEKVGVRKEGC